MVLRSRKCLTLLFSPCRKRRSVLPYAQQLNARGSPIPRDTAIFFVGDCGNCYILSRCSFHGLPPAPEIHYLCPEKRCRSVHS